MTPTIVVRHLANSSRTGQVDERIGTLLRVGRKSDNDVQFDAHSDRAVSAHHCLILLDGERLWVQDCGSTNGTYVNGERISGRVAVGGDDRISLGDRGPVIAVERQAAPVQEAEAVQARRPNGEASRPPEKSPDEGPAADEMTSLRPEGEAAVESLQLTGVPPAHPSRADADRSKPAFVPLRPPPPSGEKRSVGMFTLMTELDRVTRRERKRAVLIGIPLLAALAFTVGTVWVITRSKPVAPVAADWATVLAARKSSVYLLILHRPGKADFPLGTAWSCGPGLLATNAHVADSFQALQEGETLVARSNTSPPTDLQIVSAQLHPGYVEFNRLMRAYLPIDPDTGKELGFPPPCDAALLSISPSDAPRQQPLLPLADLAAAQRLVETSEVSYIGFPMEQSVEQGVNVDAPAAHQFVGNLTRRTDIFLAATSEQRADFLQFTLVVQGGASGSPVFTHDGRVVGLISGNDHSLGDRGGRVAITGKSFGPRVDSVYDLLHQAGEAVVKEQAPAWRNHFRQLFEKARAADQYQHTIDRRAWASFEAMGALRDARDSGAARYDPKRARLLRTWVTDVGSQKSTTGPATLATVPARISDIAPASRSASTSRPVGSKTPDRSADAQGGDSSPETVLETGPLDAAGVYCLVIWTDDPDRVPVVAVLDADLPFHRLSARSTAAFRARLGEGSAFVASWPIESAAGQSIRFSLRAETSSTIAPPSPSVRFTTALMKAID